MLTVQSPADYLDHELVCENVVPFVITLYKSFYVMDHWIFAKSTMLAEAATIVKLKNLYILNKTKRNLADFCHFLGLEKSEIS